MFDSINEKLQDRSFIQAAIDTAGKLDLQGPYDRNNNPFEKFRTAQESKKTTPKSESTDKKTETTEEESEEPGPSKANPEPDTEAPDTYKADSDDGNSTSSTVKLNKHTKHTSFEGPAKSNATDDDAAVPTVEEKPAPALMTEKEKKCYSKRYNDLNGTDPEQHYYEIGQDQGRYFHCGDYMTTTMAQRYVDRYPELGDKFGRSGSPSMKLATHHWQTNGTYQKPALDHSPRYPEEESFKCADEGELCKCKGRIHMGMRIRPDNGSEVETFQDLLSFARLFKKTYGDAPEEISCSSNEFDPKKRRGKWSDFTDLPK